jgi:hypothetical protein
MTNFVLPKENNMIEIIAETFHGDNFNICIQCPDRKKFKNNRFLFVNTYSNIEYFKSKFPDAIWQKELIEQFENFKEQEKININSKINWEENCVEDFQFKTKPYKHQMKAFMISRDLPEYGLFFEQGCGKTKVIIDTASYLFQKEKIDILIIIAPNGVHRNWITDEIPTHCNIRNSNAIWSSSMTKKQKEIWNKIKTSKHLKIFSFNIETFVSEKSRIELQNILKEFNCLLTIDESQRIKNPSAKRTEFLVKIAPLAKYRRILTGTPISNGAQNFYSQLKFLNPHIIGISSFYAFKSKYCVLGGWENRQVVGYKNIQELQNKIQSHSMRILKKECLDLPPKIYQKEMFDMTSEQLKLYKQIKNEGMALLKDTDTPLILDNVMAKMIKLRQISSGFIKDSITGNYTDIIPLKENPRILKLLDLLEQIEGKVIIWTTQTHDVNNILQVLGQKAVRYDGQISNDERENNKILFKTKEEIKYFIINLQIPEGLTLTEAETTIFYTNSYDLEKREQAEDRNHRIGTKNSIHYIDICGNETIDKKIVRTLIKKKKVSELILQDPKGFFLEYEEN